MRQAKVRGYYGAVILYNFFEHLNIITIFEINVGVVVQNVGFPGCFKVIYTG